MIRKREKTCVGLFCSQLWSLLVYNIKDMAPFTRKYLPCVSDYLQAVKGMTKFTRQHLPHVIDYSQALLSILYMHSSNTQRQPTSFLQDLLRHEGEHTCNCKLSRGLYCIFKCMPMTKKSYVATILIDFINNNSSGIYSLVVWIKC